MWYKIYGRRSDFGTSRFQERSLLNKYGHLKVHIVLYTAPEMKTLPLTGYHI